MTSDSTTQLIPFTNVPSANSLLSKSNYQSHIRKSSFTRNHALQFKTSIDKPGIIFVVSKTVRKTIINQLIFVIFPFDPGILVYSSYWHNSLDIRLCQPLSSSSHQNLTYLLSNSHCIFFLLNIIIYRIRSLTIRSEFFFFSFFFLEGVDQLMGKVDSIFITHHPSPIIFSSFCLEHQQVLFSFPILKENIVTCTICYIQLYSGSRRQRQPSIQL